MPVESAVQTRPKAVISSATITCQRRSLRLSDEYPNTMRPQSPATDGSALSRPVTKFVWPSSFTICGRKNVMP